MAGIIPKNRNHHQRFVRPKMPQSNPSYKADQEHQKCQLSKYTSLLLLTTAVLEHLETTLSATS